MGHKSPLLYTVNVAFGSTSPLDSTLYYFGGRSGAWSTTATLGRIPFPKKGIIRQAVVNTLCVTATGTNEDMVMLIRLNNTTDYTFSTVGLAANTRTFANYNLNIPVNEGDYIEFKITTPAWATNPDGISGWGTVVIECE